MRFAIFLVFVIAFPAICSAQITRYVPDDFSTIQEAIDGSSGGDTIVVRQGTYIETIDFSGKNITLQSESGPELTVIDGNQAFHVVSMTSFEDQDTVLEGFTITNGASLWGGGLYTEDASPTVTHCIFRNNTAGWGGGIYFTGGFPIVTHCSFIQNTAVDGGGGGIYVRYPCTLLMTDCLIHGNNARDGGGILVQSSTLKMINCTIYNNTAEEGGGGMYNVFCTSRIINCTFNGNSAQCGGGIYNDIDGHPIIINSIIWGETPAAIHGDYQADVYYSCIQGGVEGEGNIDEDPIFVDPVNHNYHLAEHSPCINRGMNQYAPDMDTDGEPRPCMGTVDMGVDEFTGHHTLTAGNYKISQSLGGDIYLTLEAGAQYAGNWYCMLGTVSGTAPGTPLPGGQVTLPINFDGLTDLVINRLNSPGFVDFFGVLDGTGSAKAGLHIRPGAVPLGWLWKNMYFAYTVDSFDLVSNPIEVKIKS